MPYTIAVGGFHHETNTFSPANTDYDQFLKADGWPGLKRGNEILASLPALNLPMSGFLNAAAAHSIVPTVWANAEPYGPVSANAFSNISSMMLDGLSSSAGIDAIYLDLHGAMVTETHDDGEGELLRLVRDRVGDDMPIVVSLDLHANVTPAMFELSDAITIFRTYPHIDMAQTGERAFQLLEHLLSQNKRLNKSYRQIPYLIPLSAQHTGSTPCKEIYDAIPTLTTPDVISVDFACGFPPADIHDCGASIVVYGHNANEVNNCAERYLSKILQAENQFANPLLSAGEAARYAIEHGKPGAPVIIADVQDNPGAGGSADTTELMRTLVDQKAQNAVLGCLWDAEAAELAHAAGHGAVIDLPLGGKNGPDGESPMQASFRVAARSDGKFTCHGAMIGGIDLDLGPMALLKVANSECDLSIVVTSERVQCLDQGFFRALGIEPKTQSIVVVKSTVHFRADFESIASDIVMAACPGAHPCNLETVPYQHLRPGVRLGPTSLVESV